MKLLNVYKQPVGVLVSKVSYSNVFARCMVYFTEMVQTKSWLAISRQRKSVRGISSKQRTLSYSIFTTQDDLLLWYSNWGHNFLCKFLNSIWSHVTVKQFKCMEGSFFVSLFIETTQTISKSSLIFCQSIALIIISETI